MNYNGPNRNNGPTLELCLKTVPLSFRNYFIENLILFKFMGD